MNEREIRTGKDLEAFRVYRKGKSVYVKVPGYREAYLCRYTNEKAVAAVVKGWARAHGFDV